jgi:hypothetical protein
MAAQKIEADTAKATYELELAKFAQAEYQAQRCMDATKASLLELEAVVLRQCHGRTMSQTQKSDALQNGYNKAKSKKDAINSQKQGLKADVEKAQARLFGALLDVQLLRRHVTEHVKSTTLSIRRDHSSGASTSEAGRLGRRPCKARSRPKHLYKRQQQAHQCHRRPLNMLPDRTRTTDAPSK